MERMGAFSEALTVYILLCYFCTLKEPMKQLTILSMLLHVLPIELDFLAKNGGKMKFMKMHLNFTAILFVLL